MRKKICFLFVILCIGFIWINSFFSADVSGEMSKTAERILKTLFGENLFLTEAVIRKLAHCFEYAVFGTVFSAFFYEKLFDKISFIGFCGLSAAVLDETIQLFSDGRSSEVRDVLIDFSGFSAGVLFIALIKILFDNLKRKKKKQ